MTKASVRVKMQGSLVLLLLAGPSWFVACRLYEYHYVEDRKNWTEAQRHCRDKHTDLVTVSSMTDTKRLGDSVKDHQKPAWIGLYNQTGVNDTWIWSLPGLEFKNSEAKWKSGEPNNVGGKENCVAVTTELEWLDVPCNDKKSFICFGESKTERSVYITEQKTWFEAQSYCREHHTDLISGPEQLNDTRIKNLIGQDQSMFIGLFKNTWRWSDGSSFFFRLWKNFPERTTNDQKCAAMKDGDEWETDDCKTEKPFICYEDKVVLVQQKKTWEEALYHCRDNYRDLVSITNLDEQRWVQEKVRNATTDLVWMGLRYTCTLDFWFWVTDEVVSYKNWDSGEEGDGCDLSGAMKKSGGHKWSKRNDMEELNFLCSEW